MKNGKIIGLAVSVAVALGTIYLITYVAGKGWSKATDKDE